MCVDRGFMDFRVKNVFTEPGIIRGKKYQI